MIDRGTEITDEIIKTMQENNKRLQFMEFKAKHDNAVILFKIGEEYHAFYEDAELMRNHFGGGTKQRFRIAADNVSGYAGYLRSEGYKIKFIQEREP